MIRKAFSILDKHQKSRAIILMFMIIVGAFLETVGVSAILPLVSAVTDPSIIDSNKYFKILRDVLNISDYKIFILALCLTLIVVYIVKNAYLVLLNIAQNHFATNNQRRISVRLMKCYIDQGYLFHTEHNVADLERNVNSDVTNYIYVVTNFLQLATEVLVCVLLSIFLMMTDFLTTILMIVLLGIFLIFFVKGVKNKLKYYGEQTRVLSADINRFFLEAFGGIKEVKAGSKEQYFVNRYDRSYKDFSGTAQKKLLLSYFPKPMMESLCICGLLLFMAIRIVLGTNVNAFIPVMSVFAMAAIRMLPSFNRISGNLSAIMFHKASVDALYKDLEEAGLLEQKSESKCETGEIVNGDIMANNITFAYPANPEKKILDDVTLMIPQNKAVAFVGPSGAGKTTLADIILGVLTPNSGSITVNDVDVIKNKDTWHQNVGYIPQTTFLTDDTIRANIAFGVAEKEIDDKKVWEALKIAQLAAFVSEQPDGIYSKIGDRGVKISGGQRQRLGIARAIYNNPSYIVLDEATSALDNETEHAVMDAIYQLAGQKTMIIIAHRLTTIKNCDIIYEIKDGKATKVTYEEIMEEA